MEGVADAAADVTILCGVVGWDDVTRRDFVSVKIAAALISVCCAHFKSLSTSDIP